MISTCLSRSLRLRNGVVSSEERFMPLARGLLLVALLCIMVLRFSLKEIIHKANPFV